MRNMVILFTLATLMTFSAGCSKKGTNPPQSMVNLTLIFPDDPLVEEIDYLTALVVGDGISAPIRDSVKIDTVEPGQVDILSLSVPPGSSRCFIFRLYDSLGTVIFWCRFVHDIPQGIFEHDVEIVQAGYGAATRIKLFRDNLPWDCYAMDSIFIHNGITYGNGEHQYQVLGSASFDSVTLVPGVDLVIISNDQNQVFYDNYHIYESKIDQFISNGGVVLWESCDLGWAYGSMDQAGISFPANVKDSAYYDHNNFIISSRYRLLQGLDSVLTGNYASHEGFYDLPPGSISYAVDSRGFPTLILFEHGLGWVFMTGQPLEHAWTYGYNVSQILPRLMNFVLGIDPQKKSSSTDFHPPERATRPNSGYPAAAPLQN